MLTQEMKPADSDKAFVPQSPRKPQVYVSNASADEDEGGLAHVMSQAWLNQRDGVRIASPFAIRGDPELAEAPSGRQPEAVEVFHNCEAPVKGDGSYACQCGIYPRTKDISCALGRILWTGPPGAELFGTVRGGTQCWRSCGWRRSV